MEVVNAGRYQRALPNFWLCIPTSILKLQLKEDRGLPSNSFLLVPIQWDQKASPSNSKSQIRKAFIRLFCSLLVGGA